MTQESATLESLTDDLRGMGLTPSDGVFMHASMHAIGPTIGNARTVVEALLSCVGDAGLVGMPGFSIDAYFPSEIDTSTVSTEELAQIEHAVPGYRTDVSPTHDMGIVAETFRTWPGTKRSAHPTTSICLNGLDASKFTSEHSLAWATGANTPLGKLRERVPMKILLVGVGWNRCSALHTAETVADNRRTKVRRFKNGVGDAPWVETPDVADDLNRLFPAVGAAFEESGKVTIGKLGQATCKTCDFAELVLFAADWINAANTQSGDRH